MRLTRTKSNKCWSCGVELDAASDMVGNNTPSEGDVSICVMCGFPGIFNSDMTTREPTDEEMDFILKSPDVVRHILVVRSVHHERMMDRDRGDS